VAADAGGRVMPRVVLGMPAYNRPDVLPRALEMLLSQTYRDFALVISDDKPTPEVRAIVNSFAAGDARIVYEPNPVRLGMIGNWRSAFERARALFPESEFFAWVSDHDMWHPRWLEVLVDELDRHPGAVLAYPLIQRVYRDHRRLVTRRFETRGLTSPLARLRASQKGMAAGNCIYGLFRARALSQSGVFRPVLAPDRQVVVESLALGECLQVPEILWHREVAGEFSYTRQRRMFFPTHVPLHTYLPTTIQHAAVLFWDLCLRGRGRPACSRAVGAMYAGAALWLESKRDLSKPDARWKKALMATRVGRWAGERLNRAGRPDDDVVSAGEPDEST
jgi:glycosyltransferase involved in cell wall biosynthesis